MTTRSTIPTRRSAPRSRRSSQLQEPLRQRKTPIEGRPARSVPSSRPLPRIHHPETQQPSPSTVRPRPVVVSTPSQTSATACERQRLARHRYHFVGYSGRHHRREADPSPKEGAGVYGHNRDNIHICYVGGVDANDVNIAQDTRTEPRSVPSVGYSRTSPSVSRASCGSRAITSSTPARRVPRSTYPATPSGTSTASPMAEERRSKRRTSKVWLAINMVLVWIAIYLSI